MGGAKVARFQKPSSNRPVIQNDRVPRSSGSLIVRADERPCGRKLGKRPRSAARIAACVAQEGYPARRHACVVLLLALTTAISAESQRAPTVGVLNYAAARDIRVIQFLNALGDLGYAEGRNTHWAEPPRS
jgi:hypothetical protein